MAINTKAKRMSMLSFASPLAWQHHFEVDGVINPDDRIHLLHLYGGLFPDTLAHSKLVAAATPRRVFPTPGVQYV